MNTMIFVAPPSHPLVKKKRLTYMDLSGQPMIVHEKGSFSDQIADEFLKKNKIDIIVSLELSSNRVIKKAVEDGLGIALVSRNTAFGHVQMNKLAVLPFPGPPITRKYYMVHHKDKYFSQVLNQVIEKVHQWAAEYQSSIKDKISI